MITSSNFTKLTSGALCVAALIFCSVETSFAQRTIDPFGKVIPDSSEQKDDLKEQKKGIKFQLSPCL